MTDLFPPVVVRMPVLYSGGESSRLYGPIRRRVHAWFTWSDGTPGEHWTDDLPYEDAMSWLAAAPHTPLHVSDGAGNFESVRIERAVIEEP